MIQALAGRRWLGVALAAAAATSAWLVASGHTPAEGQPPAARTSVAMAAGANAVTIVAHDMGYRVIGSPHAGRIAIRFVNRGQYAHETTLLRLKKGATLAQFKKALHQPDPEAAASRLIVDPNGEITGPALIGPGLRETAYVPLHAGRYVVICFLPGPDGRPHALMGMVGGMRVRPRAVRPAAPHTDGTIRLTRHRIVMPHGFTHGGTFKVVNTSKRVHDVSFARLSGKATLTQLFGCIGASFGAGTMIDECPGTLAGGVTDLAPGHTAYVRVRFTRGRYGYVSTDGNDFQHGLRGTFTVR